MEQMFFEAKKAAAEADLIVMPLGEHYMQSGEGASRAMIDLPETQMHLFREITAVNPNVAVVLFNGRPLDIREISAKSKAVLEVWLPGTEGGRAIINTLTGKTILQGNFPSVFLIVWARFRYITINTIPDVRILKARKGDFIQNTRIFQMNRFIRLDMD